MTRSLNLLPFESPDFDPHSTFNILIAYEDIETGKQAKKTYDFLVQNLKADCQFTNQMWKFDVLAAPQLREMAAKDTGRADIVIIACHGANLPFEVKAWIELWLAEARHPFALVAMFDCLSGQSHQTKDVRDYLAGVAKRGEMEFFAQPDEWPDAESADELLRFQRQTGFEKQELPIVAASGDHETIFPRWGINE